MLVPAVLHAKGRLILLLEDVAGHDHALLVRTQVQTVGESSQLVLVSLVAIVREGARLLSCRAGWPSPWQERSAGLFMVPRQHLLDAQVAPWEATVAAAGPHRHVHHRFGVFKREPAPTCQVRIIRFLRRQCCDWLLAD